MIRSIKDLPLAQLRTRSFTPSPPAWEDQVLYFLLVDRFSDNNEAGFTPGGTTPLYQPPDNGNAVTTEADAAAWREAGTKWVGGKLKGITNKLGYLRDLGVTTIWLSPIFKQVAFEESYHGYGIQNFLEVDKHFGTKEDLKELVEAAHAAGIYVILDIILNHAGNVFSYDPDRYLTTRNGHTFLDPRWDGKLYTVKGFNNAQGQPALPFAAGIQAGEDDAIWPVEFQDPGCFSQKGRIDNWDYPPEFCEGDFASLKDITLGRGETNFYQPSAALLHLCQVYKYWIAFADLDGFRVDTVKHMDAGAARFFTSVIHEFAQTIGKENFYLIGEITGSRKHAFEVLEETGMSAALGIADVQDKLEYAVKGRIRPAEYFDLFRNSILVGKESHTWFRNKIVVMIDDHDKVTEGSHKTRFCANFDGEKLILPALALNATTLGIPCIYYGSEQGFDGQGAGEGSDRYLREAMFGGAFGAFRSKGRHFFNSNHPVYRELAKILALRKSRIALRRGRQYLRPISGDGQHFGLPDFAGSTTQIRSVIAWSRIMDEEELVAAVNNNTAEDLEVWVTLENGFHDVGTTFRCLHSTDGAHIGAETTVAAKNGKAILIKVPRAGFALWGR